MSRELTEQIFKKFTLDEPINYGDGYIDAVKDWDVIGYYNRVPGKPAVSISYQQALDLCDNWHFKDKYRNQLGWPLPFYEVYDRLTAMPITSNPEERTRIGNLWVRRFSSAQWALTMDPELWDDELYGPITAAAIIRWSYRQEQMLT